MDPELPISSEKLKEFQEAMGQDTVLYKLTTAVLHGWSTTRGQVHCDIREFWTYQINLSAPVIVQKSEANRPECSER